MRIKTKRALTVLIFLCVVFTLFLAEFFIASHNSHACTAESCPVCAQMQGCGQVLKNLISVIGFSAHKTAIIFILLSILRFFVFLNSDDTLIGKKIRLNI